VVAIDVSFKALDAVIVLMRSDMQGTKIQFLDCWDHHNSIISDMEAFGQKDMAVAEVMAIPPTAATAWLTERKAEVRCMSVNQLPLCGVSYAKRCTVSQYERRTEDLLSH